MKKVLLILCVIFSSLVQAQDIVIYEAQYSEVYAFDYASKEYVLKGGKWEKTKFTYTREWIAIEFTPDKVSKVWWAYHSSYGDSVDCYYTEGDVFKICINTEDERINFYSDSQDGQFKNIWVISKIHKVKAKE